jgi:hypothetical protein
VSSGICAHSSLASVLEEYPKHICFEVATVFGEPQTLIVLSFTRISAPLFSR